jgi:ubiquinone/menaquinone biosynthesis C-methylase UbiE
MPDVDLATADGQDRYVPTATRDITSAGHEGVYQWIVEHLVKEGMKALDFGCGTGYGAAMMARAGATADGVDGSPTAISYATVNYGGQGVRFFVADLVKPLPAVLTPRSYDLVASSEVLEHVVDPFAFVRGMAESLKDGGVCFVGTPNRLWSFEHVTDGHLLARSHVMEFTPPALIALLRTVFDEVSLMLRLFPAGAMNNEPPPPVDPQPLPAQRPRPGGDTSHRCAGSKGCAWRRRADQARDRAGAAGCATGGAAAPAGVAGLGHHLGACRRPDR